MRSGLGQCEQDSSSSSSTPTIYIYVRFDQIQLRFLRNDFIDMGSQKRELIADLRPQRTLHRRLELGLL